MLVHYFSHAGAQTGPGRAASDWVKALRLAGVEVVELPLNAPMNLSGMSFYHGTPVQLCELAKSFPTDDAVMRIALTTWETSLLPEKFVDGLNIYDAIVTPSRFCAGVIHKACDIPEIEIIPHCFDGNDWPAVDCPANGPFTFYTIGSFGERKNVLGVLRAYLHEFTRADKTRLVILSDGVDFSVVKSIIARSGLPPDELPGLLVPDAPYSTSELVKLHQNSDCFVSTTRGEGWGLGMFEAVIMQRPVVAPAHGGQVDFLEALPDLSQWLWTPVYETPVFAGEGETEETSQGTLATLRLPNGANARQTWAEPNLVLTARRMREAYNRFKDSRDYSCFEGNREALEDLFSAPVVGQEFIRVLKEISGS